MLLSGLGAVLRRETSAHTLFLSKQSFADRILTGSFHRGLWEAHCSLFDLAPVMDAQGYFLGVSLGTIRFQLIVDAFTGVLGPQNEL